jgi:hypothetical protein
MKIKGISWIELHLEKVVLVVVAAIFLGVVAMQFLWNPYLIKVEKGAPVEPGRAFSDAERKAHDLQGAIERGKTDDLPKIAASNLATTFSAAREAPVAPSATIPPLGQTLALTPGGADAGPIIVTQVAVPKIPAPTGAIVHAYRATLDPREIAGSADLAKLVAAKQPFDSVGVTVQASFDGTALRAALALDPDGAGPIRAMPPSWWTGSTEPIAVTLQRQEQTGPDTWSEAMDVPVAPGRAQVWARANASKPGEAGDLVSLAHSMSVETLRPAYYRTIAGQTWKPPAEVEKSGGSASGNPVVDKLLKALSEDESSIERIRKQIENLDKQPAAGGNDQPGGGGGGGRGGRGAPPPPSGPQTDPKVKQRADMERRIKTFQDNIAKTKDQIRAAGGQVPGESAPAAQPEVAEKAEKPFLENADVHLWAHDMTAKPGATYRYRVRISTTNPAFGRSASMPQDQKELATHATLTSEPSEWTAPIEVPADRYFFLTSASPSDAIGPARAGVEVYQFFYGYYRKSSLSLETGDQIVAEGANAPKLPDHKRLPIWDMTKLADMGQPNPAGVPGGRPGAGGDGRPGGGGKGGRIAPPDGAPPVAPGPGASGAPAGDKIVLPPGATEWNEPVEVRFPMYLLDVLTPEQSEGKRATAIFGDGGGLRVRAAEDERNGSIYRHLQRSVKDGETQGAPAPAPEAPKIPLPDRNVPPQGGKGGVGGPQGGGGSGGSGGG